MSAQPFQNPLPNFIGLNSQPLTAGYVYFGEANQDPRSYPKAVYWDEAMSLVAFQPLRTTAGYLYRNGGPTNVWTDGDYSLMVLDAQSRQVFYTASWHAITSADLEFTQSGTGAVERTAQDKMRETFSVTDFGAVGDGVADDTPAFALAIAQMALRKCGTLFVPRGTYKVTSSLDFSALDQFALVGEGMGHGQAGVSSQIIGNFTGDVVKRIGGSGSSFRISDLYIVQNSTNLASSAIHISGFTGAVIADCKIVSTGGWGINTTEGNSFTLQLRGCVLSGNCFTTPTSIGILAVGHTEILSCDIVGWGEGIRASGTTVNITGCRFEVNKTAMKLGIAPNGASLTLSRSAISGNSFEANDIGVDVYSLTSTVMQGLAMQGSVNSPAGQSQIGLRFQGFTYCTFSALSLGGTYSNAAVIVEGSDGNSGTFQNILAGNSYGGNSRTWDVKQGLGKNGSVIFDNTTYGVRVDDTVVHGNARRHGQVQYLSQVNYLAPNVEGKNLRGKNIALASGVATKAIAFTGAGHGAGSSFINTATPGVTGGATLAVGTYYYLATAVTEHGESSGTNEKTAVVGGANNSVTMVFFGMATDGFKRRVYRGTAPGVYDGYFELPLNSNANFVDIGQAFDGHRSPPTSGIDDTSMLEPDANYSVTVTPSWLTTVRVTGKSTSGFTVDFGTVTPDANQTIDWHLIR